MPLWDVTVVFTHDLCLVVEAENANEAAARVGYDVLSLPFNGVLRDIDSILVDRHRDDEDNDATN